MSNIMIQRKYRLLVILWQNKDKFNGKFLSRVCMGLQKVNCIVIFQFKKYSFQCIVLFLKLCQVIYQSSCFYKFLITHLSNPFDRKINKKFNLLLIPCILLDVSNCRRHDTGKITAKIFSCFHSFYCWQSKIFQIESEWY